MKINWNISGHDSVLKTLEADIFGDNLAHANLFTGPDDIGKFTAVKTLALYLQCTGEQTTGELRTAVVRPCGECAACREIKRGYHADTLEIANDGEKIKIETVRNVIEKLNMTRQANYKILMVQNIERMTPESANAMLKTLEDPPEGVIFLLTASRVTEVLPTILSRVRVYKFKRLSDENIIEILRQNYPLGDENILEMTAWFAAGRPGRALTLMQEPESYEFQRKMFDDIELLMEKPDRTEQFVYVADLVKTSQETKNKQMIYDFLDTFQAVLRKKMVACAGGDADNGRASHCRCQHQEKIVRMLLDIEKARDLMKRNVNTRMLLENLMLNL